MNDTPHTPHRASRRFLPLYVGLFLFAVYLLSYRGGFHSVDEVSTFAVTESLVKFGALDTDQIAWTQWTTTQAEAQGFFGVGGHVYSKKGFAISLAQAPLYALALYTPGIGMLQTVSLLNALLTAATAALLVAITRRLGFSARAALAVALLYGLATIAWVYAKYLFSGTLAGFLLTAAFALLLAFRQEGGWGRAALAGFLGGLTVLARANNLLLLALLGGYLLLCLGQSGGLRRRTGWAALFAFGGGAAVAGAIFLAYNGARSGNPLQTGYDLSLFQPNILLGLYKLLFSPLRGLFIYSPLLVLSVPGWFRWRRTHPAEAWLVAGQVGVTLLLFSAWSSGEGLSWGSRFLVPVVPLLVIPLAPLVEAHFPPKTAWAWGGLALASLSFAVQVTGVAINPWVYLGDLQAAFGGAFFLERTAALYDFSTVQVLGQLRNWQVANSDVAWWQPGQFDGLALGVSLALVLLTGWLLGRAWRATAQQRGEGARAALALAATVAVTGFLLARYYRTDTRQFGPPDAPYLQALDRIAAEEGGRGVIVTVAQYDYHLPMNRFRARIPLIGFAQSVEPLPPTAFPLLERALQSETGRAWLVTVGWQPAAADNRAEAWLATHAFPARDEWLAGGVRRVSYGLPRPAETVAVGETLGGAIELQEAAFPRSARAGEIVPVTLAWRAIAPPAADYRVFLQLLAADGQLVAGRDAPPQGGYRPTGGWRAGETIADRHGLPLPDSLAPGRYRLIAGLYDPTGGARLPVAGGGDFIELGTLAIGE